MTQNFLQALYSDLPDGMWFYIWLLNADEKRTHWLQDTEAAVKIAEATTDANVYWPVAFYNDRLSSGERGKEADVAGIVALVADIDFQGEGHPRAPKTEADAIALIESFPLRPTACVNSGHGLQCAWLFREPWQFDDDAERLQAKQLSCGWWHTLAARASRMSYELDAVHDLTRVMRVPGTLNVKRKPVPVELRWLEDKRRYNPQDFEEYSLEMPAARVAEPLPTVDLSSTFPKDKFDALCANLSEFKLTWDHKRRMPKDNTASGYDMALCLFAVQAGWTDDEITALLREHQRLRGNKPHKLTDARYYARTICNARKLVRVDTARDAAGEAILDETLPPDDRLKGIAERLDITLTHVQIVTGDPSMLRLWIGGKCAEVPVTALDNPAALFKAIINTARFYPVTIKPKEQPGWRDIVNTLLACAEEVEAGPDATLEGELRGIIRGFLEARPPADVPEGEALRNSSPFRRAERIWFRLDDLAQYIRAFDRRIDRKGLSQRLRVLGASQGVHKVAFGSNGAKAVRFYGLSAEDFRGEDSVTEEQDV